MTYPEDISLHAPPVPDARAASQPAAGEPLGPSRVAVARVFIDGKWHAFSSDRHVALFDPDTEARVGTLHCADAPLVDQAVNSAGAAHQTWSGSPVSVRVALLDRIADLVEQRADGLARSISDEIGAPIDVARSAQVRAGINHLRATRDALRNLHHDAPLADDPTHRVRYVPVGPSALITPWNWPINQVVLKVGAALAAGCAMVLKPSEFASQSAIAFAEIMAEAGVPDGVFNLLIGDAVTGAHLVAHPEIAMVSFTGSSAGGRQVAQTAASRFARCTMELGGKSANLLFEDCDVETAVRQGVAHCFRNAGQSCNAASRMLVARPIYDAVVALAARTADETAVDRPSSAGPHIGPLVNRAQFERVRGMITAGLATEARLVAGGPTRPEGVATGFYVRPTVFADVAPDNSLFQDEIFGPVLTITPFEDEDHAIELANATRFGLAAYLQTSDPVRAARVSARLDAGMVQINGTSRAAGAPFGGVKASGHGREGGAWGIRSFQEVVSISGLAVPDD